SKMTKYNPQSRVLIYAEGEFGRGHSKTAEGMVRYGKNPIVAVVDSTREERSVGEVIGVGAHIPFVKSIVEALIYKPEALLIGVAPRGGALPPAWRKDLLFALEHGMDLINGLHYMMEDDPEFAQTAQRHRRIIWDVRKAPADIPIGAALAAEVPAQIVLTVGSDCVVGKKTTVIEIARLANQQGRKAIYIPTGQTGIMIAGFGIVIDRVIGDFMSGATEKLILENAAGHDLILVEGQGSLLHPGYSGVTLSLLHGSMPSHMILCHQPTRKYIRDSRIPIPPLKEIAQLYEVMALPIKKGQVIGISLNCFDLTEEEALREIEKTEKLTSLPTTDCVKFGAQKLLDTINENLQS
ncbi:MAG: DUF1611 domain-containing protein, partial [Nitrospira sp.]|nr:DUF1611 domain-containing protein [Nitrospira sp.]